MKMISTVRNIARRALSTDSSRHSNEILNDIHHVLEEIVRPYAQSDGGDVVFESFDRNSGTLWVKMQGACKDCISSTVTLRFKVLGAMKLYCPEVVSVQRVDIDDQENN
jgi:NFU1 iron-sulfur cluster scaffold homolog, mitochondrial